MASLWTSFLGLLGGAGGRSKGLQNGLPGSYNSAPSVNVTMDTALQLSAVWACTKLIAESIASMDIYVYKVDPKTKEKTIAEDHPLTILFSGKVNRYQTRQEYIETLVYQNVLLGNDYSAIERNEKGNIISLLPLMTQQMRVSLGDTGDVAYLYNDGQNVRAYAEPSVWHNKLFGNGLIGLNPLSFARNSIGVGLAAEQSVGKIYNNGGKRSGILMLDKVLNPEQRETIKKNFSDLTEGNDDRLFVLEAGMKFEPVSMSPNDIELLASRRFQIEDIARFFGVPSVMINDTSSSTAWGSGIEQIVNGWYKTSLRPYLKRYEASMRARLLTPGERARMCIEFDIDSMLQLNLKDRVEAAKNAVQGGIQTPNEARKEEGLPPVEGGDTLFLQQQMLPINSPARGQTTPAQGNTNANGN